MNQKTYKLIFVIILISFVVFVFQSYQYRRLKYNDLKLNQKLNSKSKLDYVQTRDFMRYECKNMKRIGGPAGYIKNSPHPLYRIDGAWFMCLDEQLDLKKDDCNILSFGINNDYSFDEIMNKEFGCHVFSFDPQIEAQLFSSIRAANKDLSQSVEIKVNPKWSFYKLGVSNDKFGKDLKSLQMGQIVDLNTLLELTNLKNKVVDYFKMDIEGPEKNVLEGLDMSYACKYIKQLALEAHKNFRFAEMQKLEQCFMLFRRDTRFFDQLIYDDRLGYLTEFQAPNGFDLKLKNYFNETYLAELMFVSGELYFINRNFLSSELLNFKN